MVAFNTNCSKIHITSNDHFNPLRECSSVVLSTFAVLCDSTFAVWFRCPLSLPVATTDLLSVSMGLSTLDHVNVCFCGCVWLLSLSLTFSRFTCVKARLSTSFLFGWRTLHCVDVPPSVSRSSAGEGSGRCYLLVIVSGAAVSIPVQVFVCTPVSNSFRYTPRSEFPGPMVILCLTAKLFHSGYTSRV